MSTSMTACTQQETEISFSSTGLFYDPGLYFSLFPLLVVFVPTAGSSLGQRQCLITGRTFSKASLGIAVGQITQEVG